MKFERVPCNGARSFELWIKVEEKNLEVTSNVSNFNEEFIRGWCSLWTSN